MSENTGQEYEQHFREDGLPKIMSSNVTMTLYTGDGSDFDVKHATELGAMLLLDKPLILIGIPGAVLPSRLRKAADVVIEDWSPDDPTAQARLMKAIKKLAGKRR